LECVVFSEYSFRIRHSCMTTQSGMEVFLGYMSLSINLFNGIPIWLLFRY